MDESIRDETMAQKKQRKKEKIVAWLKNVGDTSVERNSSGNIKPVKPVYRTMPKSHPKGRDAKLSEF